MALGVRIYHSYIGKIGLTHDSCAFCGHDFPHDLVTGLCMHAMIISIVMIFSLVVITLIICLSMNECVVPTSVTHHLYCSIDYSSFVVYYACFVYSLLCIISYLLSVVCYIHMCYVSYSLVSICYCWLVVYCVPGVIYHMLCVYCVLHVVSCFITCYPCCRLSRIGYCVLFVCSMSHSFMYSCIVMCYVSYMMFCVYCPMILVLCLMSVYHVLCTM